MLKTLSSLLSTFFFFATIAIVVIISSIWEISDSLPEYKQLAKYEPPVTTRLYAGNGQLMMEYASEKRFFVPVDKIPELVKNAFISAEDKKFYSHSGIDYIGIIRAMIGNVQKIGTGKRPAGASTITQQVAKNMLLTSELSYVRKIKEALLASRLEQAFTKNHILELYLNEIYLGNRSYGVAAAALNYFNKPLNDLSIEEVAYLAALPKAPNNYNPKTKKDAAIIRRNWVIDRMLEEAYITEVEAENAKMKPLEVVSRANEFVEGGQYFSEEVRREVEKEFGKESLNEGGLMVRTTLNPKLQKIASDAFMEEINKYDRRHGWRGALANIKDVEFEKVEKPLGTPKTWQKALVTNVSDEMAQIKINDELSGKIILKSLAWARKTTKNQGIGAEVKSVKNVLQNGDVILVENTDSKNNIFELRQLPNVEGGLVAIDPHTGKVLAIVGGYSFYKNQFNRATQALRQTGSSFKPLVYLAALDNGYSPNDLILDAPFVLDQGPGLPKWKPMNYSPEFYGLTTFRQGIEKSRNLMTVRLAQALGMDKISEYTKKLGVNPNLPKLLSMSLGAGDSKLINMTTAYAMMVNGGKKINPYFIEQIQDRHGTSIFKNDKRKCDDCKAMRFENQEVPQLPDLREQIIDPLSAYQMTSILEGVAIRGTGGKLRSLNKHLAGKTGTTNQNKDAWFIGFSPDLVVGVYVGFDEPRTLGRFETGASTALPIFYNFMEKALKNQADIPFRIPSGIKLVRINYQTGKQSTMDDKSVIVEALKPDFDFAKNSQKIVGGENSAQPKMYETKNEEEIQLGGEY